MILRPAKAGHYICRLNQSANIKTLGGKNMNLNNILRAALTAFIVCGFIFLRKKKKK